MNRIVEQLNSNHGGHLFEQIEGLEWTYCENCYGRLSLFEIEEGLWPARIGRHCPAILLQLEDRTNHE